MKKESCVEILEQYVEAKELGFGYKYVLQMDNNTVQLPILSQCL